MLIVQHIHNYVRQCHMLVAMNVCIIWVRVVKSKVTLFSLTLGVWVLCICIVCTTYPRSNPLLVGSSLSIAVLAPVSWFREIRLPYSLPHYQEIIVYSIIMIIIMIIIMMIIIIMIILMMMIIIILALGPLIRCIGS